MITITMVYGCNVGRIESFTSFKSEAGPVDDMGEWKGQEVIFTLQVLFSMLMIKIMLGLIELLMVIWIKMM